MRLPSSKYHSLKRILYIGFLICAGSLLVSYNQSEPQFNRSSGLRLEEHRGDGGESVKMVEEWKLVLEGQLEERTVWENLTATDGNRTAESNTGSLASNDALQKDLTDIQAAEQTGNNEMSDREFGDEVSVKLECENSGSCLTTSKMTKGADEKTAKRGRLECKQDLSTLPSMAEFYTVPGLNISPPFSETITEYYVTVEHDVIVIQIKGFAVNCQAEVRLTDRYGPSGATNYTLGVGLNKVQLHVVNLMHSEPWILNTYTLNIYRLPSGETGVEFDERLPHQVCYLRQDCGLPFVPNESCGLQRLRHSHWKAFQHFSNALPQCKTGHAEGQWVLPCRDCHQEGTCFWSEAVWQAFSCTHRHLSRKRLRKCLDRKKILFIGDSTLRGMMHYLMEQANGSLTEWDKTHDTKLYDNINNHRTTVAFAYYPQFWLPTNQRPLFEESLHRLINISAESSLLNNHETVLVVGGVHWLSSQHLERLSEILAKNSLSKIRVIAKTLGAGFHLQVNGLHHLTLNEQQRLVARNTELIGSAESLGFDAVDTFSMTMARYKDFVEGKCACHFHKVKETLPSFANYLRSSVERGQTKLSNLQIQFHIEGDVNAAYSELLLNRICDGG